MEIIAKIMNIGLTVTTENTASSYGIPVVVFDGQTYGDNDVMDEYGYTGRKAKIDLANLEYRDDAETYNWICRGTGNVWAAKEKASMKELFDTAHHTI